MQPVTITCTNRGHYAPTLANGPVWQPSRTVITKHIDGERIEVVDTKVTSYCHNMMGNLITMDMTDLTPAELTTHDAIAAYWYGEARRWAVGAVEMESEAA